jgi:YHS domain-containing protein
LASAAAADRDHRRGVGNHAHSKHMMEKHSPNGPTAADQGAWIDPVCGMKVTAQSPHSLQHQGRTVYFCCAGCAAKFRANPANYPIAGQSEPIAASPASQPMRVGAIFTCPMHPQVRQAGSGSCPCSHSGGHGADHCLPMRARVGDSDVDHGRGGPRGPKRVCWSNMRPPGESCDGHITVRNETP